MPTWSKFRTYKRKKADSSFFPSIKQGTVKNKIAEQLQLIKMLKFPCLEVFFTSLSVWLQLSCKFPSKSITLQEVWGLRGQREGTYRAAAKVRHYFTWVFPDAFSSHGICHELSVKSGAKAHPLCKGSGKNSSKRQPTCICTPFLCTPEN